MNNQSCLLISKVLGSHSRLFVVLALHFIDVLTICCFCLAQGFSIPSIRLFPHISNHHSVSPSRQCIMHESEANGRSRPYLSKQSSHLHSIDPLHYHQNATKACFILKATLMIHPCRHIKHHVWSGYRAQDFLHTEALDPRITASFHISIKVPQPRLTDQRKQLQSDLPFTHDQGPIQN